jgi:hypothetical protein
MNALSLIRDCRAAGIQLQARGDRLHIDAPAGALTAELRQRLADHKADILAMHAIRVQLQSIANNLGIPRAVVDQVPVEDLAATAEQAELCDGHTDGHGDPLAHALLLFYLKALAARCSLSAGGVE